jgi:nucleotide-binding universal stress UspA family protein
MTMAGEIVLGYDASDGAKAALPHAVDLARAFGVPLVTAFAYGVNPVGGVGGDQARATEKLGEGFLAEAAAAAKAIDAGVTVEPMLVDGLPVEGLIAAAEQLGARMLVIGGNGRGPMVSSLLGSISYKLLHQTKVPVLVVQPHD